MNADEMSATVRAGFASGECAALSRLEVRRRAGLPISADMAVSDLAKFAALVEEIGEVARAIHDGESHERLCEELRDVMAVAGAWLGCELRG